ncbi:hypothetical protein FQZ97_864610 [compost metagenome]
MGQHRQHARPAGAAPRRSADARLPVLRRSLAGAEDGRIARRSAEVPRRTRGQGATLRREGLGRAEGVRRRTRLVRPAALGRCLRLGKAAPAALCVLRARGQAVLPGAQGAGRPVRRGAEAVLGAHRGRAGADLAQGRALFPRDHRGRHAAGPVLYRPVRARRQARRRVDGRRPRPQGAGARRRADAGRVPDLQLLRAGGQQARAVHARRSDHAVP